MSRLVDVRGVAQAVGDRADVDAGGEQVGGDKVSEVVDAHAVEPGLGPQSLPPAGDQFGSPRAATVWIAGEDLVVGLNMPTASRGRRLCPSPVEGQRGDRRRGQRHEPDVACLGWADDHPRRLGGRDRPLDPHCRGVGVEVAPSQPTHLSPPGAGGHRDLKPAGQHWAMLLGGANRARTPSIPGGVMVVRGTDGRVAAVTVLRASQLQRTACAAARWSTTWRSAPATGRSGSGHRGVELVAAAGCQLPQGHVAEGL
jgi:hypothetical protein